MNQSDIRGGPNPAWSVGQILRTEMNLTPLVLGVLTGALLGMLVLGGGARLAMRVVALLAGMPTSFTWPGTLAILAGGAVVGALLGVLYVPVRRWTPWSRLIIATLFGLVLAALIAFAFTRVADGEFGLIAPWIGAALFAPLPVYFSLALSVTLDRQRLLAVGRARSVTLGNLLLFAGALGFAFSAMATLFQGGRVPSVLMGAVERAGMPFHQAREALAVLYLLLALTFLVLHVVAFWLGGAQGSIRRLGLGQLLLAGLVLRAEPLWPVLVQTDAGAPGEWLAWALAALGLGAGLLVMVRLRAQDPDERAKWNWLLVGVVLFVGGVLAVWLVVLLVPALQLRGWTAAQTMFAVAPLSLPWLALPAALIGAARAGSPVLSPG